MSAKNVRERFVNRSSSAVNVRCTTLLYDDGSTSCNCPGWCRRVAPDGSRECKHTLAVKRQYPEARSRTEPYRATARQFKVTVTPQTGKPVTLRDVRRVTIRETEPQPTNPPAVRRAFDWSE